MYTYTVNKRYTLHERDFGRVLAAGSYEAIHAAARLLWGAGVTLVSRYDRVARELVDSIHEAAMDDLRTQMDAEIFGSFTASAKV